MFKTEQIRPPESALTLALSPRERGYVDYWPLTTSH